MSVSTISPVSLADLCRQQKNIDLIDVRTPVEFREIHAVMACNVPLDRLDLNAVQSVRKSSQDEPLYFICRSGTRGKQACEKLLAAGFTNVVNVEGGTLAWEKCGLPVQRGKKAFGVDRQMRIVAGSFVLLGALLGWFVDPAFIWLSAFIGAGLIFAGVTDKCPMMCFLSSMPWNQVREESHSSSTPLQISSCGTQKTSSCCSQETSSCCNH